MALAFAIMIYLFGAAIIAGAEWRKEFRRLEQMAKKTGGGKWKIQS